MKYYSMLDCEIEVDEAATKQWYTNAENWGCECGYCNNFLEIARRRELPDEVHHYLSIFGILPEKATYVCCLTENNNKLLYQFSYRIAGNILKDNTSSITEDARFCHETYPYGASDFPEPHFDLEFYVELPWVIDDTAQ